MVRFLIMIRSYIRVSIPCDLQPSVLFLDIAAPCELDLVFALDSSTSVGSDSFTMLTSFVADIVSQFNIGPTATQVGVVRFSFSVSDEILLGSVTDPMQLMTQILGIQYIPGGTLTHLGIENAHNQITNFGRAGFKKVLIVATDGAASNPTLTVEEAGLAKEDGITVIALGIGDQIVLSELMNIASEPADDTVILANEFSSEALSSILNQLTTQICIRELAQEHKTVAMCRWFPS